MSEYRPIKTKIWNDSWFLSLTPEEKAVWFFLLTNQNVQISGIYELPVTLISPLVGSSKGEEILKKFEQNDKIVYKNGWIYIKNYLKNQTNQINKKDNIIKSIMAYLSENPQLVEWFNLRDEAPYKPLCRPLGKVRKEESKKGRKEESMSPIGDEVDFSFKEQVYDWLLKGQRHIHIIGLYAQWDKKDFTNKGQWQEFIARNLKIARKLINWPDEELIQKFEETSGEKINGHFYDWGLETIYKKLTK